MQTYVYWRGEIADEVAGAIADKAREGVRCKVILDALGAAQMERRLIARCATPAPRCSSSARPSRTRSSGSPTAPTGGAGRRRQGRDDGRGRDRRRVDGRRRGPRPLARHACARPRARSSAGSRAPSPRTGSRATGEVLAGEGYLPDLEPVDGGGRCSSSAPSAKVGDTNAEALYYLAIASARSARSSSPPRTSSRGRRLPRRSATRPSAASTSASWSPAPHRQGLRPGRRAGRLRATAGRGRAAVRVPADDAAREDARRRRHMVVRRHGQLRQPLFPAARRGHARGLGRATSPVSSTRRSSAISSESDEIERERWRRRAASQRLSEAATTVLRREL